MIPAFCTVVLLAEQPRPHDDVWGREIAMNQTCYALASKLERRSLSTACSATQLMISCRLRTAQFSTR